MLNGCLRVEKGIFRGHFDDIVSHAISISRIFTSVTLSRKMTFRNHLWTLHGLVPMGIYSSSLTMPLVTSTLVSSLIKELNRFPCQGWNPLEYKADGNSQSVYENVSGCHAQDTVEGCSFVDAAHFYEGGNVEWEICYDG